MPDNNAVQRALAAISRWNDEVQAVLFSETRLARTFPASAVAETFRYNFCHPASEVPRLGVGDVVVIPAGVGHCAKKASADLLIVGAYPAGAAPSETARPAGPPNSTLAVPCAMPRASCAQAWKW
ncbi:MAG: hypothetical protein M0002_05300 [Rhodospirillales bacterium]|nr:hypothetical protein [Rhodospirillales bacterium]